MLVWIGKHSQQEYFKKDCTGTGEVKGSGTDV
jgi:hypothetical protein